MKSCHDFAQLHHGDNGTKVFPQLWVPLISSQPLKELVSQSPRPELWSNPLQFFKHTRRNAFVYNIVSDYPKVLGSLYQFFGYSMPLNLKISS